MEKRAVNFDQQSAMLPLVPSVKIAFAKSFLRVHAMRFVIARAQKNECWTRHNCTCAAQQRLGFVSAIGRFFSRAFFSRQL